MPRHFLALILFSTILIPGSNAVADMISLTAVEDTYVEFGDFDDTFANHGGESTIDIERSSIFTDWAILIRFDMSAIPAGATINGATLQLREGDRPYAHGSGGALDFFEVSNVLDPWDEMTVTGDTAPGIDFPVVTIAADPNPDISVGFYVEEWVNGGVPNYGLFIQNTGFNHFGNFVSREGSPTADRPRLIVDFTAVPEPATSLIGLMAISAIYLRRKRHN